ncbi:MAG: hypothetical protein DSM106950_43705 [Stigonema ocellatum SAG 48.90 = DSM 106950]|nr:hypothetical protein [Stigonema ocellatum SAG 48.90 = DSM 106950]
MNNFRRFIVLVGLTFTLMLGMFTAPVFAQSVSQQTPSGVSGGPGPVVTVFVYNFPNEDITYTESQVSAIPSSFDYQGQHFEGNQIRVVKTEFGKAASVSLNSLDKIDVVTKFTLLLPNDAVKNGDNIKAVGITVNRVIPRPTGTTSYEILNGTVKFKF